MIIFFRSFFFNVFFLLWTALCSILIVPLFFLPRFVALKVAKIWSIGILWAARVFVGLTFEVEGQAYIETDQAVILACKHQSTWDTLIFHYLFKDPAYVLKNSLMQIPFYGWFLKKLEMIPVTRQARKANRDLNQMFMMGQRAVANRRPLVIFPEGTRTQPGEKTAYFSGVFSLYTHLNIPVIPAGLNSGLFWGRRKFFKKPGKIILKFCPPLLPGLARKPFMEQLKEAIENASKTEENL